MNILYYVELYPIRDNPYEYFHVAKIFCENIKKYKSTSRIVCSDDIYWKLFHNGIIDSMQRVPLNRELLEWIENKKTDWDDESIRKWTDYLSSNNDIVFNFLYQLKNEFNYDVIVLWGKNETITNLAHILGIKIVYIELSPSRKPYFEGLFISELGVNGDFSKNYNVESPLLAENDSGKREKVLVALQLYDDLNFQLYSPFESINDFIDYVTDEFDVEYHDVYVKPHPHSYLRRINSVRENIALEYADKKGIKLFHSSDEFYLREFDSVVTINSSVGFEAASIGKKSFVLGDACYKHLIPKYNKNLSEFKVNSKQHHDLSKIDKFRSEFFIEYDQIESYLEKKEFNKSLGHERFSLFDNYELSSFIGLNIFIDDNNVAVDNGLIPVNLLFDLEYDGNLVNFYSKDNNINLPLMFLEVSDGRVVSGMKISEFNKKYKPIYRESSSVILIGVSFNVVGILK